MHLKYQSFSGFEDIAERFLKVINDEVYQSTIAGRPFADVEKKLDHILMEFIQSQIKREITNLLIILMKINI